MGNTRDLFKKIRDTKGTVPVLWPPDSMSQLIGKDPDTGKD